MSETIIPSVLTGKLDATLLMKWLNDESLEDTPEDCILNCCNKNEFVTCFLSFLRNQTDSILQTNSNAVQILQHSTPEKLLSTRRKHRRSISDPTSEDRNMDSLTVKVDRQRSHESPSKDRKRTGRRVKTKLFTEADKSLNQSVSSSDESRLSTGVDRLVLSSTPMKNGIKPSDYPNLPLSSPVTPRSFVKEHYERCDTPRLSHRHSKSSEKNCLGDYMVNVQKSNKKKRGRISSDNDESKVELDLTSSEMFPEIGARKSSSLRSEKRRIKPTNIDKSQKSVSLNSFSVESIQTSPLVVEENSAFKQQRIQVKETNNFETERNILKQERHKLMEKFNILNTSLPQKPVVTPQIKITQKNSIEKAQSYIKSDTAKVSFKDKLDLLVDIYEILIKNNLIMSLNTEIYFLISILISKQFEEDYILAESKLKEANMEFLLKTIHNSTYFAVKSLWHQRVILELILDKSSLKTLGENKKVRSFYPDLAKFLLNCYGLRCENESSLDRSRPAEPRSHGVVCFNSETDNIDNFPSMMSFQSFKKQRDMFYEIWRWYGDSQSGRSSLRARVKALLCAGAAPSNHAHLAALFTSHMAQHCLPTTKQESKLSKLQRRLTCPNAPESHRLPQFTTQEMFYKEFIINAENESFRVHLRDAIASEIVTLDATHIAPDERGNTNPEITKEYLALSKKLALLAKFLGLLASLPYTQVATDSSNKNAMTKVVQKEVPHAAPKEKVLENDLVLRNYSQPTIDLKGILITAQETGRLSFTIPWIVHYLSQLDYTSLRIKYYQDLLKILFDTYTNRLKIENSTMKKNTIVYLKSILGWLFDLPHFPQELFYENRLSVSVGTDVNIDSCDLIDEAVIIELCPHLRDLNVLLATCRVSQEQKDMGSYRHITPVSLTLNPEDRIKNKEKELQARLEEELLKSQPSSTRRVLELVIERVTSACVRELSGHTLNTQRTKARNHVARFLATTQLDQSGLLPAVEQIYTEHLTYLRTTALQTGRAAIQRRAQAAVCALLAAAPAPLVSLVVRAATSRLAKWLTDNWNTTAVLCKDIEGEMKTLLSLGELATTTCHSTVVDVTAMTSAAPLFAAQHVSAAACVINLKEQVCLLLEGSETPTLTRVLSTCAVACSPHNIFVRPPTQKAILQLSIDLCVVYVSRKPKEVNESFLLKLHAIWNICCPDRKRTPPQEISLPERREELSPTFRNFEDDERIPTPVSDDELPSKPTKFVIINQVTEEKTAQSTEVTAKCAQNTEVTGKSSQNTEVTGKSAQHTEVMDKSALECEDSDVNLEFFDRILCPRNIMLLSDGKSVDVWEGMATVLVFLLKHDYLSEDSLTEQCLAVYRQDWSQNVLESLSTCMKSVSARWSRSSTGKFTLFLDFLAEFCGDMDYEPLE